MSDPLDRIAERKIAEAVEQGLFDDLPGRGEPLELEDLSKLDPELRGGYLLLKGHGYVSEEQHLLARHAGLCDLLRAARDAERRRELGEEVAKARLALAILLERRGVPAEVIERLIARAAGSDPAPRGSG